MGAGSIERPIRFILTGSIVGRCECRSRLCVDDTTQVDLYIVFMRQKSTFISRLHIQ